ncbi:MAG: D-alanyl-D-alanine carboxypeptidase/D-alanyl-D-alanine-endopeptidase [Bacteroidia bacterium]|nr:D-alanyl-D-alanine carboxypeptidase/D-alanyl-D-alanine-endopeptidase [Bacteroidia bacterium]
MNKSLFLLICVIQSACLFSQDVLNMALWEKDSAYNAGVFSYSVRDLESGELMAEYQSGKYVVPASTLKLVTSYAALKLLGPGFRFQTMVGTDGIFSPDSAELTGNIIIEGEGDPTLQSRFFYEEDTLIATEWVKKLKQKGLKTIKGKIVIDMKKFPVTIPDNWIWSDLSNAYGAFISPLNYRDNQMRYVFKTASSGEKAEVLGTLPEFLFRNMDIKNYVISKGTEDDAYVTGSPFEYRKKIFGKLPPHQAQFYLKGSLPEPWLALFHDMKNQLKAQGIFLADTLPVFQFHDDKSEFVIRHTLLTHFSPTLDKMIRVLLTYSHNLYTEALLIAMGKGNLHQGIERVKKLLSEKGLDYDHLHMSDGSGLSRNNLVTTDFFTQLLYRIYQDKKIYGIINNSLPVSGKNGTLLKVGKGTPLEGNLRAKTGYINKVRSFAGYMKTKSGKNIAFSLIVNNYDASFSAAQKKLTDFMLEIYDKF